MKKKAHIKKKTTKKVTKRPIKPAISKFTADGFAVKIINDKEFKQPISYNIKEDDKKLNKDDYKNSLSTLNKYISLDSPKSVSEDEMKDALETLKKYAGVIGGEKNILDFKKKKSLEAISKDSNPIRKSVGPPKEKKEKTQKDFDDFQGKEIKRQEAFQAEILKGYPKHKINEDKVLIQARKHRDVLKNKWFDSDPTEEEMAIFNKMERESFPDLIGSCSSFEDWAKQNRKGAFKVESKTFGLNNDFIDQVKSDAGIKDKHYVTPGDQILLELEKTLSSETKLDQAKRGLETIEKKIGEATAKYLTAKRELAVLNAAMENAWREFNKQETCVMGKLETKL